MEKFQILGTATLKEALECIESNHNGVIFVVDVVQLQEGNTGSIWGVALNVLVDEGEDGIAKEEELILVTDSLQILELSMVGILESFKKLLVKLL